MTIHKRLLALCRDPEVPRWCRWAVIGGMFLIGPLDEVVIYPTVACFLWVRRRHVLARHGFGGVHVLAGLGTLLVVSSAAGVAADLLIGMLP